MMSIQTVCRVAISGASYGFDKLYDYDIPTEWVGQVQPGIRVLVPFGRGSRMREAMVVRMGCDPHAEYERKAIAQVLDTQPVLDDHLLTLAAYMCSTLFCTFYDCARAMLPAGLWFRKTEQYTLDIDEQYRAELAADFAVLQLFTKRKRTVSVKEMEKKLGTLPEADLNELYKNGILHPTSEFDRRVNDKTITMYGLSMPEDAAYELAERGRSAVRMDVVNVLAHEGQLSRNDLKYMTGASDAVLRAMVQKGMLHKWEEETFRLPERMELPEKQNYILSPSQQEACDQMEQLLLSAKPEAALLYGVTGSGKTAVYIRLIERTLQEGQSAIVLVPEIGLTPQFIRRFMAQFGDCTAVLHSALSVGERYDSWKRIRSGDARVIVGTRSAVFAPAQNLGLIVLDEEQDDAYKSENHPRYHARDIAKYRAMQEHALVVFGSATPSIETYYGAEQGKYPMFTLRDRYAGTRLPDVTIADMRGLTRQGYTSAVGPVLRQAMEQFLRRENSAFYF